MCGHSCLCLYVCVRVREQLAQVLSCQVDLEDQIQVIRLGNKCPYPWSGLTSHMLFYIFWPIFPHFPHPSLFPLSLFLFIFIMLLNISFNCLFCFPDIFLCSGIFLNFEIIIQLYHFPFPSSLQTLPYIPPYSLSNQWSLFFH